MERLWALFIVAFNLTHDAFHALLTDLEELLASLCWRSTAGTPKTTGTYLEAFVLGKESLVLDHGYLLLGYTHECLLVDKCA